jgi:hypothetical protein
VLELVAFVRHSTKRNSVAAVIPEFVKEDAVTAFAEVNAVTVPLIAEAKLSIL